ncbi:GrpB family protein [Longimicrobium sp.]|jgi:GrpB-like predicted nucleotidyltransferase (UPF0157 family)|uniref:GrpB family protein n=1 Tax=Longimicrobium sp. TaxID=2029185 RepID=UPI002F91FD1A
MKKVEVVPHDPRWRDAFESEAERIVAALGPNVFAIHHIGSTAIPGIHAKPVIDLLVEVDDIEAIDARGSAMESIGYQVMGEFGMPGRRYFRKDDRDGTRTHQVHAFRAGSGEVKRHLAFRDYMIAHPADAERYGELKRKLAEEYPWSMDGYVEGKDGFIREMDRRAAEWRSAPRDGLLGGPG